MDVEAINRAWDPRLSVISIICHWIATKFSFSTLQRKLEKILDQFSNKGLLIKAINWREKSEAGEAVKIERWKMKNEQSGLGSLSS